MRCVINDFSGGNNTLTNKVGCSLASRSIQYMLIIMITVSTVIIIISLPLVFECIPLG